MHDVKIYLEEYGYLDLDQNIDINLTYQLFDVSNITSRKSNFSKSIKIPFTKNNNKIFSHAYKIDKQGGFSTLDKHFCILYLSSLNIKEGFLVLNSIEYVKNGDSISGYYEVTFNENVIDFFDKIKNLNLRDLDFSSDFTFLSYKNNELLNYDYGTGDHIYNDTTVRLISSYNDFRNVYTYPFVNYNWNTLNYDDNTKKFPYEGISLGFLYPAFYFKAIFDKIFYDAGYVYDSTILNDEEFTTSGGKVTGHKGVFSKMIGLYDSDIQLTERIFSKLVFYNPSSNLTFNPTLYTSNIYSQDYLKGFFVPFSIDKKYTSLNVALPTIDGYDTYSSQVYDSQSVVEYSGLFFYNAPAIKVPSAGKYKVEFSIDCVDQGGCKNVGTSQYPIDINTGLTFSGLTTYHIVVNNFLDNNFTITESSDKHFIFKSADFNWTPNTFANVAGGYTKSLEVEIEANEGDIVYAYITRGVQTGTGTTTSSVLYNSYYKLNKSQLILKSLNSSKDFIDRYDTTLKINEFIWDMEQTKFVKSILNLFNIYIQVDTTNNNKLILKTLPEFYDNTNITHYNIDYSNKIDISTLSNKLKKKYIYKYSHNNDNILSNLYKNENGLEFGEYKYTIDTNYIVDDFQLELDYQSYRCDMVKTKYELNIPETHTGYTAFGDNYLQVPNFSNDINNNIRTDIKRIGKNIGIYNTNKMLWVSGSTVYNNAYYLKYIPTPSGNTTFTYDYVYIFNECSMIQPVTKTYSYNGLYYYNGNSTNYNSLLFNDIDYTTELSGLNITSIDNLFNKYYANQLENIVHQDSREVTMYVNMTYKDIFEFNFRNIVQIEGQNYYVQSLEFNLANLSKPSKIKLLKMTVPNSNSSWIFGTSGTAGSGEEFA